MTDPLDLAQRLFGNDPPWTNRVLWDTRCADCGTKLAPSMIVTAVESLCTVCVKRRNFRWRDPDPLRQEVGR